jgi:hypothetical protein
MESAAWKALSGKAHEVYLPLNAKWGSETRGGEHPKDVSFGVKDCHRYGVKISREQLYNVMVEYESVGMVKYNRAGKSGKKNTFRFIDDWREYQGVSSSKTPGCPADGQVRCRSQGHPVPSEITYEEVLCDQDQPMTKRDPIEHPSIILEDQEGVWRETLRHTKIKTARELVHCIVTLIGEPSWLDTSSIEDRIQRYGVEASIGLCLRIAAAVPISEPADFYLPFYDETDRSLCDDEGLDSSHAL